MLSRRIILEGAAVLFTATFGITSLYFDGYHWETLFFSFTVVVIAAAFCLALALKAGSRLYWLSFALTATAFLALSHIPDVYDQSPRMEGSEITTQVLRFGYGWLNDLDVEYGLNPDFAGDGGGGGLGTRGGGGLFCVSDELEIEPHSNPHDDPQPAATLSLVIRGGQTVHPGPIAHQPTETFMRIGNCLWALFFGWIAGHFSRTVSEWSRRNDFSDAEASAK